MPWMLKMYSTKTLPPMRPGRMPPSSVTTGIMPLRAAWRRMTAPSREPLRARGADVVGPDHVEHARAGVARERGEAAVRHHHERQRDVPQHVAELRPRVRAPPRPRCATRSWGTTRTDRPTVSAWSRIVPTKKLGRL